MLWPKGARVLADRTGGLGEEPRPQPWSGGCRHMSVSEGVLVNLVTWDWGQASGSSQGGAPIRGCVPGWGGPGSGLQGAADPRSNQVLRHRTSSYPRAMWEGALGRVDTLASGQAALGPGPSCVSSGT